MRQVINKKKWDERRAEEVLLKGSFLGLVLWTSSILWISISGQISLAEQYFLVLPMIITGYVFTGILIQWLYTMPGKENIWLKGPAFMYWLILLFTFVFAEQLLPYEMRSIINVNAAVLLLIWLGDFFYLRRVARELNGGKVYGERVLIETINKKPENADEFYREIEEYCRKNHKELEFVEKAVPALVRIDGRLHRVELKFYYVTYVLKFIQLPGKVDEER